MSRKICHRRQKKGKAEKAPNLPSNHASTAGSGGEGGDGGLYDDEDDDDDEKEEEEDVENERLYFEDSITSYLSGIILGLLLNESVAGPSSSPVAVAEKSSPVHDEATCSDCLDQRKREQGLSYPENIGGVPTFNLHDSSARMGWRLATLCVVAVMVNLINENQTTGGSLSLSSEGQERTKIKGLLDSLIRDPSAFFLKCLRLFRKGIVSNTVDFTNEHFFVRGYLIAFANFKYKSDAEREHCEIAACPPCLTVLPYISHLLETQKQTGGSPIVIVLQAMGLGASMIRSNEELALDTLRKTFGMKIVLTSMLPFGGYGRATVKIVNEALSRVNATVMVNSSSSSSSAAASLSSSAESSAAASLSQACKQLFNSQRGETFTINEDATLACQPPLCVKHIAGLDYFWAPAEDGKGLVKVKAFFGKDGQTFAKSLMKMKRRRSLIATEDRMVGESTDSSNGCETIRHIDVTAANPSFKVDPSMAIFIEELSPLLAHVFSFLVSRMIAKLGKVTGWKFSPVLVTTHFRKKHSRCYYERRSECCSS